jgi:hypothetical protein
MRSTPGANHVRNFGDKFTYTFCRLDRFINVNIFTNSTKQPSFETLGLNKLKYLYGVN